MGTLMGALDAIVVTQAILWRLTNWRFIIIKTAERAIIQLLPRPVPSLLYQM